MITDEDLEKRGYKKWNATQAFQHSDYFYQKRFTDELGIKYYIAFVHYPASSFGNGQSMPASWMMELNNNEPHYVFQWSRADSIQAAEDKCEMFFRMLGCKYYELHETTKGR